MSFWKNRRTFLLLFTLCGSILFANPFLGGADVGPEPVRPPSRPASEKLIDRQLEFRESVADLFATWRDGGRSAQVLLPLMALSFLYGLFHAAGPGHRKTVIFSLFLGRRSRWWEPAAAGFLSGGLHGVSAIFLVLLFKSLAGRIFLNRVDKSSIYLEGFTYLGLALLALALLILSFKPHGEDRKNRGLYSTIAVSSAFPCPAAVLILTFSLTQGLLPLGIVSAGVLSLGMGLVVTAVGYLARTGRETLFLALKRRKGLLETLSHGAERGAYLFLILFSLWMAFPFLVGLIRTQ